MKLRTLLIIFSISFSLSSSAEFSFSNFRAWFQKKPDNSKAADPKCDKRLQDALYKFMEKSKSSKNLNENEKKLINHYIDARLKIASSKFLHGLINEKQKRESIKKERKKEEKKISGAKDDLEQLLTEILKGPKGNKSSQIIDKKFKNIVDQINSQEKMGSKWAINRNDNALLNMMTYSRTKKGKKKNFVKQLINDLDNHLFARKSNQADIKEQDNLYAKGVKETKKAITNIIFHMSKQDWKLKDCLKSDQFKDKVCRNDETLQIFKRPFRDQMKSITNAIESFNKDNPFDTKNQYYVKLKGLEAQFGTCKLIENELELNLNLDFLQADKSWRLLLMGQNQRKRKKLLLDKSGQQKIKLDATGLTYPIKVSFINRDGNKINKVLVSKGNKKSTISKNKIITINKTKDRSCLIKTTDALTQKVKKKRPMLSYEESRHIKIQKNKTIEYRTYQASIGQESIKGQYHWKCSKRGQCTCPSEREKKKNKYTIKVNQENGPVCRIKLSFTPDLSKEYRAPKSIFIGSGHALKVNINTDGKDPTYSLYQEKCSKNGKKQLCNDAEIKTCNNKDLKECKPVGNGNKFLLGLKYGNERFELMSSSKEKEANLEVVLNSPQRKFSFKVSFPEIEPSKKSVKRKVAEKKPPKNIKDTKETEKKKEGAKEKVKNLKLEITKEDKESIYFQVTLDGKKIKDGLTFSCDEEDNCSPTSEENSDILKIKRSKDSKFKLSAKYKKGNKILSSEESITIPQLDEDEESEIEFEIKKKEIKKKKKDKSFVKSYKLTARNEKKKIEVTWTTQTECPITEDEEECPELEEQGEGTSFQIDAHPTQEITVTATYKGEKEDVSIPPYCGLEPEKVSSEDIIDDEDFNNLVKEFDKYQECKNSNLQKKNNFIHINRPLTPFNQPAASAPAFLNVSEGF